MQKASYSSLNSNLKANTNSKTKEYLFDSSLTQKSYHNFINSLNSKVTKRVYHLALLRFLSRYNFSIEKTDEFLNVPAKEIESRIIDNIIEMQNSKLSNSSVEIMAGSLQHFCSMNDVVLNWKKIRKFINTDVVKNVDEAYTHNDIRKLISISDLRSKMMFLILVSTGIRVDALHDIKLRNLTKISSHNLYKIVIYEGFKEQYYVFSTPECASVIDQYLEYRKRSGEALDNNSYLIRESFDNNDLEQVRKRGRPVATSTLRNIIRTLLVKAGIRENNPMYRGSSKVRHKKAQVHGFRKFVTGQFVNSKVNPEIREMLLGHKIGLASAYYRPTQDEMLNEYLKAVNNLTIEESQRLKKRVTELEQKQSEIDLMKYKHDMEMNQIRNQIDKMESLVSRIGNLS